MNKTVILFALLVGCGPSLPMMQYDGGVLSDSSVMGDASPVDAGTDTSDGDVVREDASSEEDAGVDAATTEDAGTDASSPEDAGMIEVDAAVPPTDTGSDTDSGIPPRGDVVELGVDGDGTCVLTSTSQMWCWGNGHTTPAYVADAVAISGTCGIAFDGHVFCWRMSGITNFAGTDAAVVGTGGMHVRRADGALVGGSATWAPPSAFSSLGFNCGLFTDGHARCWDWTVSAFSGFTDVGAATDVARAGTISDSSYRACVQTGTGVRCDTSRGTTGSALLQRGSEVEMAGGRACAIIDTEWTGPDDTGGSSFHPAGVYCTSDVPFTVAVGYYPFNALGAADAVGRYTNISGTDLRVGTSHACILSEGAVMCWGSGARGQLGGAATTGTPVTVF